MFAQILIVDDDKSLLSALARAFRGRFLVTTAASGREGLERLRSRQDFAVVVADMQMPGMNGIEFLREVAIASPDTSRLMLTGNADMETPIQAVNQGHVLSFLSKPCDEEALAAAIQAGIAQHQTVRAQRMLIEQSLSGSIHALVDLLSVFDPKGFSQTELIREYALRIANRMQLEVTWELAVAAQLSRIGTLAIPIEVQNKARLGQPLTFQEEDLYGIIPKIGSRLLANIPRMQSVARFVLYSQSNFNGEGAPAGGLSGKDLPVESRILMVAENFVRLVERRKSQFVVVSLMQLQPWKYDPDILAALEQLIQESPAAAEEPQPFPETIADLRSGMILVSDTFARDGMLLLTAGTRLTPILIELLRSIAQIKGIEEPIQILRPDFLT